MREEADTNGRRLRVGVRKQPEEAVLDDRRIEPVLGDGPVRRIVFDDEPTFRQVEPVFEPAEPKPAPEPRPAPAPEPVRRPAGMDRLPQRPRRRNWDIEEIHREVDRLHRNRTWGRPLDLGLEQPGTIYTTTRGAVREATFGEQQGKRVLFQSEGEGTGRREKRFVSSMVDRVIRGVGLGAPPSDRLIERALRQSVETHDVRTEAETRRTEAGTTTTTRTSGSRSSGGPLPAFGDRGTIRTASMLRQPPTAEPAASPTSLTADTYPGSHGQEPGDEERSYQPQCAALTQHGVQCRNSSRIGAKYCASHRNYRARSVPQGSRGTDTVPSNPNAPDTSPNIRNGKSP